MRLQARSLLARLAHVCTLCIACVIVMGVLVPEFSCRECCARISAFQAVSLHEMESSRCETLCSMRRLASPFENLENGTLERKPKCGRFLLFRRWPATAIIRISALETRSTVCSRFQPRSDSVTTKFLRCQASLQQRTHCLHLNVFLFTPALPR